MAQEPQVAFLSLSEPGQMAPFEPQWGQRKLEQFWKDRSKMSSWEGGWDAECGLKPDCKHSDGSVDQQRVDAVLETGGSYLETVTAWAMDKLEISWGPGLMPGMEVNVAFSVDGHCYSGSQWTMDCATLV